MQFFIRPTKEDAQYEGIGKPINLSADIIAILPKDNEKIRLFEYDSETTPSEWMAKHLHPNYHIVDYQEKVFTETKNGEIEMRLHIFVTPAMT